MQDPRILVIGSRSAGKTCFIRACASEPFTKTYQRTMARSDTSLKFTAHIGSVRMGEICMHLVDLPGNEIEPKQWKDFDAFIVMYDIVDDREEAEVRARLQTLQREYPYKPVVICGTKGDFRHHRVYHDPYVSTFKVSAKDPRSLLFPLEHLARELYMSPNMTIFNV
jgi:GTPase SAR1 family protein